MRRCITCCYPDSKPDLHFDEHGECAACRNYKSRPTIDWDQRHSELLRILEQAPRNDSGYDCIVASSGGKDSTWQVLRLIELGARPLVVTATTCYLTPTGRYNIDNLARFASTVELTPNRDTRAKLNVLGLELVGDISWPEHLAIFSMPMRAAKAFGIETVFYGENPQREYGGPLGAEDAQQMSKRWVSEFGGLLGLRASDVVGLESITAEDMADYVLPEVMPSVYFLGQFLPWDSQRNAAVAARNGMKIGLPSPANWWNAENLDNAMTGLHCHVMYRKYGYGRLCAQISVDIRKGLISRDAALQIIEDRDGLFPSIYAGVGIDSVLDRLGKSRDWLDTQLHKFTNMALFSRVIGDRPILKEWDNVAGKPDHPRIAVPGHRTL